MSRKAQQIETAAPAAVLAVGTKIKFRVINRFGRFDYTGTIAEVDDRGAGKGNGLRYTVIADTRAGSREKSIRPSMVIDTVTDAAPKGKVKASKQPAMAA